MYNDRRKAFTIMELIIVVTIIVLLIAIMIPSMSRVRSYSRTAKCASNLHQFGVAVGTWRSQMGFSGSSPNSCSMLSLKPFMTDPRVYLCPEDNAPLPTGDGQIAVYIGERPNGTPVTDTPGNFLYDMPLASDDWCWRTDHSPSEYALNYEDVRPNTYGNNYYNCYIVVDMVAQGMQLTSIQNNIPSWDTNPPGSTNPGYINGMYQYHLVTMTGTEIFPIDSNPDLRFERGDSRKPILNSIQTSYGMNGLFSDSMRSNGIAIQDFLTVGMNVAGPNRDDSEWPNGQIATSIRPGFNRHLGRFNAMLTDGSVQTGIVPKAVDPTISSTNRQKWFGE